MARTTTDLAQQLFDASSRLYRTDWPNPQMLAQELFAIFRSLLEKEVAAAGSSTTVETTEGSTTRPSDNIGGVTVTKGGETFNSGSGPDYNAIDWPDFDAGDTTGTPDPTLNPITLYGEVLSKEGGSTYRVKCWAKDPATSAPISTLSVRQGLIDPDETIPAGTPVLVIVFLKEPLVAGGPFRVASARMQVPVWM
jgi:hypothetical protein